MWQRSGKILLIFFELIIIHEAFFFINTLDFKVRMC